MLAKESVGAFVALTLALHGCGNASPDGGGDADITTSRTMTTITTTPTTTTTLPKCVSALVDPVDSVAAAKKLNAQFFENNSGVLFRGMNPLPSVCDDHSCFAWKLDFANSFTLLSPASWCPPDGRYTVYPGLASRLTFGWPGFIGSPEALENMVDCSWPVDGSTARRNKEPVGKTPANCGCATWEHCGQPDGADWCTEENHGSLCAWPGDATDMMLEEFKKAGGGARDRGARQDGLYGYNEVAVNREKWADGLPDSIQAFQIPRECSPGSECYNSFAFWYADWKKKFGAWPIVHFDAENEKAPYSALPQPSESGFCEVGDCVPCPGDFNEICSGDTCCADGSTCPSASEEFTGCEKAKAFNCVSSVQISQNQAMV